MYNFHKISPERLKNLTTLPERYTYHLGLGYLWKIHSAVTEILHNEVTYPKNRNLLTRLI